MRITRYLMLLLIVLIVAGCVAPGPGPGPAPEPATGPGVEPTDITIAEPTDTPTPEVCSNESFIPGVDSDPEGFLISHVTKDIASPPIDAEVYWFINFEVDNCDLIGTRVIQFIERSSRDLLRQAEIPMICAPIDLVHGNQNRTGIILDGNGHVECSDYLPFRKMVQILSEGNIDFCDDGNCATGIFEGKGVGIYFKGQTDPQLGYDQPYKHPVALYPQLNPDHHLSLSIINHPDETISALGAVSGDEVGWDEIWWEEDLIIWQEPKDDVRFQLDLDPPATPISVGERFVSQPAHTFSSDEIQTLFIGVDPNTGKFFHGEIIKVVVDPNDACGGCTGD